MEGLLPQCDLEHFDHVIMDLRHLEHTLATVVNGLHEDDHCTDKSLKAVCTDKKKFISTGAASGAKLSRLGVCCGAWGFHPHTPAPAAGYACSGLRLQRATFLS